MKKVKDKYIRLTESELKRLISEEVEKLLEYKKPRRDLVNAAKNYAKELIKHWCVVKFYVVTHMETPDLGHWIGEVAKFMNNISDIRLKGDMDDYETRKTAITEGFEKAMVMDDPSLCERFLIQKLIEERVPYERYNKYIKYVSEFCFGELPRMIEIMAKGDVNEIGEYVKTFSK